MPARYVIDKERRLVISTAWGRLSLTDIQAHRDQLLSDPDFDPGYNQLVDATAVTDFEPTTAEIRSLAQRRIFSGTSRRALVGSSTLIYGVARVFQVHHEFSGTPSQVTVFYNMAAALRWLGAEEPVTIAV
jgi:hypothetical protein